MCCSPRSPGASRPSCWLPRRGLCGTSPRPLAHAGRSPGASGPISSSLPRRVLRFAPPRLGFTLVRPGPTPSARPSCSPAPRSCLLGLGVGCSVAALGLGHLQPHAEQPHRRGRARPGRAARPRPSASTSGSLVGAGQGQAAGDGDERPVAHLDPDPRRRPALAVDVGDHPARSARAPRRRSASQSVEVGLVGLLAAVRPRHPRRRVDRAGVDAAAEPAVPRPHRRPELRRPAPGRRRRPSSVDRVDAERGELAGGLAADPPQRVGRAGPPSPSNQVVVGEPADARAACRSRWRSWPAACCRRCRPSSAAGSPPAPRRGSCSANSPGRRVAVALARPEERLVPAEHLDHHRHAAPLEDAQRVHHLGRRRVVGRRVDRQEHRVRALAGRDPQRHAGADAELAGLVRRGRRPRRARSGRRGRRPRPAGRPARAGAAPRPPR